MKPIPHSDSPCVKDRVSITLREHPATFVSFEGLRDNREHFAILFGNHDLKKSPWVRIHSECITGDLFGSARCDCGDQLNESLELLRKEGGILLYLRQEGRGIGLYAKLKAYLLQEKGCDTFTANLELDYPEDMRRFDVAAEMLKALGITTIKLLTNNPQKKSDVESSGVQVEKIRTTGVYLKKENANYLRAKKERAGHDIALHETEVSHDAA